MLTRQQDEFVKKYWMQEGTDIISYMNLSEEDKISFSKDIVGRIVKSIEDRRYELDNVKIGKSKGKITDLENYDYIKDSLDLLSNMQSNSQEKVPYLEICTSAHKNLVERENDFNKGYKLKKTVVEVLYSSLVLALIQSVSFLISVSVDYIKDPMGNYQANLRYNMKKNNDYPTVNLECLDKFNLMCKNGEMDHFFNKIYTDKNLNEGIVADTFATGLSAVVDTIGGIGHVLAFLAKFLPSIPELLRLVVSSIYNTRVAISDYLRLQAHFLEVNTEKNRNLANPNKKSIAKQEKIMKNLVRLADKIDIDQKTSTKNTKIEIEQQNKNISESIKKKSSSMNSVSNNHSVEEIIL